MRASRTPVARFTRRLLAAPIALALVLLGAAPARAVDVAVIASVIKGAYDAYDQFLSGKLTLDDATDKIINTINSAKTEILSEIDKVQADHIASCTQHALIEYASIKSKTVDSLQAFASDATLCVTDAWGLNANESDLASVDQIGFALNVVGPLALSARARAYGADDPGIPVLLNTVIEANRNNLRRLTPNCHASRGEVVNGRQEVSYGCVAYNGDSDFSGLIFIGVGEPLPTNLDYSAQLTGAVAHTSYPISVAALDGIFPDPVIGPIADQVSYEGDAINLTPAVSAGTAPYTWSATGLPPGLSLNSTGTIAGTPTTGGTYAAQLRVTDVNGQIAAASFRWTVHLPLSINPGPLTDRTITVGSPVDAPSVASGGLQPYAWSATGLPAGLSINGATGRISGTVRPSPNINAVVVTVTDANGRRATRAVTWTVDVVVPNVLSIPQSDAANQIRGAGLVESASTQHACVSPGEVLNQNPNGGTVVAPGTTVHITVDSGTLRTCGGGER
jgi:hypothetical protein